MLKIVTRVLCFQNAFAYFGTAVIYNCKMSDTAVIYHRKMFMKSTPGFWPVGLLNFAEQGDKGPIL